MERQSHGNTAAESIRQALVSRLRHRRVDGGSGQLQRPGGGGSAERWNLWRKCPFGADLDREVVRCGGKIWSGSATLCLRFGGRKAHGSYRSHPPPNAFEQDRGERLLGAK